MRRALFFFPAFFVFLFSFPAIEDHLSMQSGNAYPAHSEEMRVVYALMKAYGGRINGVDMFDGEIVFTINGRSIFYSGGRMLAESHRNEWHEWDSIFYPYQTGKMEKQPESSDVPRRRADFLDALVGSDEETVRASCRWEGFLGRRVFVHTMCIEPLRRTESIIMEEASGSEEVRRFISDIRLMYSLDRRSVHGTENISYHAYGLAIDIIPRSYRGKHVYWKWSAVFDPRWFDVPIEKRWSPPEQVVSAFERNGFIWGGKWYHFDGVHFEYRPEIIELVSLESSEASLIAGEFGEGDRTERRYKRKEREHQQAGCEP